MKYNHAACCSYQHGRRPAATSDHLYCSESEFNVELRIRSESGQRSGCAGAGGGGRRGGDPARALDAAGGTERRAGALGAAAGGSAGVAVATAGCAGGPHRHRNPALAPTLRRLAARHTRETGRGACSARTDTRGSGDWCDRGRSSSTD